MAGPEHLANRGITHVRLARGWLATAAQDSLPLEVEVQGTTTGIQATQFVVWYDPGSPMPLEMLERSLMEDGVALAPLKCDRSAEGVSYGNLVWLAKAPGKQGVGLWASWNCAHDRCGLSLTILYRRAALADVECAGS